MKKMKKALLLLLSLTLSASVLCMSASAAGLAKDEDAIWGFEEEDYDEFAYEIYGVGPKHERISGDEVLGGNYSYKISVNDKVPNSGFWGVKIPTGVINKDQYSAIALRVKYKAVMHENPKGNSVVNFWLGDGYTQNFMSYEENGFDFVKFYTMEGKQVVPQLPMKEDGTTPDDSWQVANYPFYNLGLEFDGWMVMDLATATTYAKDGMHLVSNWKLDQSSEGCIVSSLYVGLFNAGTGSTMVIDDLMFLTGDYSDDAAKDLLNIPEYTEPEDPGDGGDDTDDGDKEPEKPNPGTGVQTVALPLCVMAAVAGGVVVISRKKRK